MKKSQNIGTKNVFTPNYKSLVKFTTMSKVLVKEGFH